MKNTSCAINKIQIECDANSDWNGFWHKNDVEDDMKFLNYETTGNEWINFIFNHMFFEEAAPVQDVLDCFLKNDYLRSVTVYIDNMLVKIRKYE